MSSIDTLQAMRLIAEELQQNTERFVGQLFASPLDSGALYLLREQPVTFWQPTPPVEGTVRLERLGPAHRQFKIVKLIDGRRVLVDQHAKVRDPFSLHVPFRVPLVKHSYHAMQALLS